MGLFFQNYNRPGPGVPKDVPEKNAFAHFWELLFRKVTPLIKVNLIFAVPFTVILVLSYFLSAMVNPIVGTLPYIFVGPLVAGIAYVTRNFVREEHAFIFSDFIDAIKNNWFNFLLNGLICVCVYWLMTVSISYYLQQVANNRLLYLPLIVCFCFASLFIFAQYYIPVMLITFDLKLTQIYKNGFIFSVLGLWKNILITVVLGAEVFVYLFLLALMPATAMLAVAMLVLFFFSFNMFLINFLVYPLVDKYMIQPQKSQHEPQNESDFRDEL